MKPEVEEGHEPSTSAIEVLSFITMSPTNIRIWKLIFIFNKSNITNIFEMVDHGPCNLYTLQKVQP